MQNFASDKISSFYLRGRTWLYFLFFELPNLVFLFFFFNNGEWFFFFFLMLITVEPFLEIMVFN